MTCTGFDDPSLAWLGYLHGRVHSRNPGRGDREPRWRRDSRIQVLTNPSALDLAKQLAVVEEATEVIP
ncbi:MAG: hypothetical protein JO372_21275 [Solirubrobacterales bacterium]|nr:hypothetical protein [Solirubrobacterales bacterium]